MVDWAGISGMGCEHSSEDMAIHDPQGHTGDNARPVGYSRGGTKPKFERNYTVNSMAVPDSSWVKYAFIKRQTDKAILFAFQSGKGLFEHWVPKSVITGLQSEPNRVKIQQWFITRNSLNV